MDKYLIDYYQFKGLFQALLADELDSSWCIL